MIPVAPLVIVALRILAPAVGARGGSSVRNPRTTSPMVVLPILALGLVTMAPLGGVVAVLAVLATLYMVCMVFGRWIIAVTFVRLGMPRAAYYAGVITGVGTWQDDVAGAACLLAVRAALETDDLEAHAAWLEDRLGKARKRRGVWLVAAGLFRGACGHTDWARSALVMADAWPQKRCPSYARHLALRWLTCDALTRGQYAHATIFAGRGSREDRWLRAVHRVVGSHVFPGLGIPAPSERQRRLLAELEARVMSAKDVADASSELSSLDGVVRAHVDLSRGAVTAAAVERVARGWDHVANDPHIRAEVVRRGLALEIRRTADVHLDEFLSQALSDLSHLVTEKKLAAWSFAGQSERLSSVFTTVRNDYLREVALATRGLIRRAEGEELLHPTDEAVELGRLRLLHLDAWLLGGSDLRPILFRSVHRDVCSYGVWQDKTQGSRDVAHMAFRWLLEEAYWAADDEAITLQKKNSAVTA